MKTKYDFIKELLKDRKINQNQREKIIELASKEISLEGTLEERVQNIEQIIFSDNPLGKLNTSYNQRESPKTNLLKYKDPINLYNALLTFNQDPILKTTCHPISSENIETILNISKTDNYNFKSHLGLIKQNFIMISKNQNFTNKMWTLINNYLNGNGSWSSENISISWSSKHLEEWANNNPKMVPNPEDSLIETTGNEGCFLEVPFVSKLTNQSIFTLNDLVLYFKSLWHIKFDNPLQQILEKRNADYNYNEWANIRFNNFSQTLNLYTDVDKLVQTYSKIIDLIKENNDTILPEIAIAFYEEGPKKILSITQLNTFWKKSILDTIEKPFGNSMEPIIKNQIIGLCDLHIRALFENSQSAEINLWDGKKREAKEIPYFNGVEYLLILKK